MTTPHNTNAAEVAATEMPLSERIGYLALDLSYVDPGELKPNTMAILADLEERAAKLEAQRDAVADALRSLLPGAIYDWPSSRIVSHIRAALSTLDTQGGGK